MTSRETQELLSTIGGFAKSRNSSCATDVIFLDLAKAFDSVLHDRLLIKLRNLGLEGKPTQLAKAVPHLP